MNINRLMKDSYRTACNKGWHDEHRTFGDLIALCHSELSEALEEFRQHGLDKDKMIYYNFELQPEKPEGVAVELADLLIRVFDMCEYHSIPLAEALIAKLSYNKTRSYRHGNKKI